MFVPPPGLRQLLTAVLAALLLASCGSSTGSPSLELVRPLDFSPFDSALNDLDDARLTELDQLVTGSSVSELRAMVTSGEVTSRELTLTYISRIRTFDGGLHAVAELNPDALAEADRLDEVVASGGELGRLHGMPILLKDNIAAAQLHNTAGAAALADHAPARDAFVVDQLRSDGAVILGKANLSEWAFFMSTEAPSGYSALGGQVVNPYGEDLEVLGSSTGSAVAASADFAAATIGTETTGSIIAPAAANGVAGMRPTLGLVSGDLIIPITVALDSAGPIAKDVASLAEVLTAMVAEDPNDANAALANGFHGSDFTEGLADASLDGITVGVPDLFLPTNDDLTAPVFQTAVSALEDAGATVVTVAVDESAIQALGEGQLNQLAGSMRSDVDNYLAAAGAPITSLADVIAFNEENPDQRSPFGQDLLAAARDSAVTAEDHAESTIEMRTIARNTIESAANAGGADVIMSIDNTFSLLYATAGTPAVTVPMGADEAGQHHGATFVGLTPGTDAEVLAIAHAFEQTTNLRTTPSLVAG